MAKKETSKSLFATAESFKRMFEQNPAHPTAEITFTNLLKRANALLTSELTIKGLKFEAKHEGSDWWESVKLMYPIRQEASEYVLVSEAADWRGEKNWKFDSKALAMEYIERLVQWKHTDRKAGYGDRDADIERVQALVAAREAA